MRILVIADHDNVTLKPSTFNVVSAAKEIGGDIDILVVGADVKDVAAEAAAIPAIKKVIVADAPQLANRLSEPVEKTIVPLAAGYTHLLFPATSFGKSVAPRVAAKLNVAQISEIVGVVAADTFTRPIYAGSAIATVQSKDPIKIATVRATAFPACERTGGGGLVESVEAGQDSGTSKFLGSQTTKLDRPELTAARIVVAGGRGLGSGENYRQLLEPLADALGAALGASRAAVDAGFVSNDYQVGQTGKIVAPELYFAIGISGAIQHLAGMKDSKIIVAINKDAEAPIFEMADFGLVADLFDAVPELVAEIRSQT